MVDRPRWAHLPMTSLAVLTSAGLVCPWSGAWSAETAPQFDYTPYARVLERYLDDRGLVDYAGLKDSSWRLDKFVEQLADYSPKSNARLLPKGPPALAYWLNAYNALMMARVVEAYPTTSVMRIGRDQGVVFTDRVNECGGQLLSLDDIEGFARAAGDPRVHFALNCASMGCPPLRKGPFLPAAIDAQLDGAVRDVLGRKYYCRLSDNGRLVGVSHILTWYSGDFRGWLKRQGTPGRVLDYVALYAPEPVAQAIAAGAGIDSLAYDWRLNDQAAPWADTDRS